MREVLNAFWDDWKDQWRRRSNPASPGLRAGRRYMAAAALFTIAWTTMMALNASLMATLAVCVLSGLSFIVMMVMYGNAREHDQQLFEDLALTMPNLLLVIVVGVVFIWAGFTLHQWFWLLLGVVVALLPLRSITRQYRASLARVRHTTNRDGPLN